VPTGSKISNRVKIPNIFTVQDENTALAILEELKYLVQIVGRDT
jgi:hypothetical protein